MGYNQKKINFYMLDTSTRYYSTVFLSTTILLPGTTTVPLGKIKSENLKNDPLDTRIGHRALLPYTNKL
jgi:hypothetical protein